MQITLDQATRLRTLEQELARLELLAEAITEKLDSEIASITGEVVNTRIQDWDLNLETLVLKRLDNNGQEAERQPE
jgi:hypothetical protein